MTAREQTQTRKTINVDRNNVESSLAINVSDVLVIEGQMRLVTLVTAGGNSIAVRYREQRGDRNFISYTAYERQGKHLDGLYLEGLRLGEGSEEYSQWDRKLTEAGI